MNTSKSRSLNLAFVLDAQALDRITDLLTKKVLERIELDECRFKKEIEYEAELSDGTTKSKLSIEDLLDLPNSPTRQIKQIHIHTPYVSAELQAAVLFKNEAITPVYYTLRGDEETVESLSSNLEDEIAGVRQWYTPLTSDRASMMAMMYGLVLSFLTLAFVLSLASFGTILKPYIANIPVVAGSILLLVPPAILFGLALFGAKLFPTGIFAIGQGEQRHKRLKKIRTTILISVPLTLLIEIVAALIVVTLMS
jgi:hypothetical protein